MEQAEKLTMVHVEFNVGVTDEDIDDIMCGALEGGITYWCIAAKVDGDYLGSYASEQISRGGRLKLFLDEPYNDTDMFVLDKEMLMKGLKKYLEDPEKPYEIVSVISDGSDTRMGIDTCQCDATVCDMIVQYALFDEVVFG